MAGVRLPLPFTTRMTVVQLKNGELLLHSPIAFDAGLAKHLQSMGTIRHLVSPNQFHYAHIGEWSRAFPDALAWASPGVRRRARARGIDVQFKMDVGPAAPEQWRDEIDQIAIPGGIFGELVFFHKMSKTLILADTIINIELDKINQPWRFAVLIAGYVLPSRSNILRYASPASVAEKRNRQRLLNRSSHGSRTVSFSATGAALSRMAARHCAASLTDTSKGVLTLSSEHCFLFLILLP